MERHRRTLIKTVTWRFVAIGITWIVVYIFSGDIKISTEVALTANILKTLLYYVHERMWNRMHFGRET